MSNYGLRVFQIPGLTQKLNQPGRLNVAPPVCEPAFQAETILADGLKSASDAGFGLYVYLPPTYIKFYHAHHGFERRLLAHTLSGVAPESDPAQDQRRIAGLAGMV